ncbi:hypothetical protein [Reyranella sp.]|uniref:hypothetical protein n=1 Tax=Reyranella sp. TaxID=1929291 RepID=UPI003D0ADD34
MRLPRDAFIGHFQTVFQVHCLKLWRKRGKEPPEALPRCLHEWIGTANGIMDVDLQAFRAAVWPVVEELHRKGEGARPTPAELTGALFDVLSEAAIEVAIGPSRYGHG